jgi:hypothetical protein
MRNTLAYCDTELIVVVKSLIVKVPGKGIGGQLGERM